MRIDEDVGKTFAHPPYGQNDVLQSYDLPVTGGGGAKGRVSAKCVLGLGLPHMRKRAVNA